jgi:hypothetical protein
LLAKEGVQLDLLPMAQYEELMQEPDAPDVTERLPERVQPDDIVLILHSSGWNYLSTLFRTLILRQGQPLSQNLLKSRREGLLI